MVIERIRYLVIHCQKIIVNPEKGHARGIELDLKRLVISWDDNGVVYSPCRQCWLNNTGYLFIMIKMTTMEMLTRLGQVE